MEFNMSKYFKGECVHQFFMGLDIDQFGTVRSALLATEPFPSLNKVHAAILRLESQQSLMREMGST